MDPATMVGTAVVVTAMTGTQDSTPAPVKPRYTSGEALAFTAAIVLPLLLAAVLLEVWEYRRSRRAKL